MIQSLINWNPVLKWTAQYRVSNVFMCELKNTSSFWNFSLVLESHYSHRDAEMAAGPSTSRQGSCHDDDDGVSQDALSNSSLRRKLFFHGEEGTPISPVR